MAQYLVVRDQIVFANLLLLTGKTNYNIIQIELSHTPNSSRTWSLAKEIIASL